MFTIPDVPLNYDALQPLDELTYLSGGQPVRPVDVLFHFTHLTPPAFISMQELIYQFHHNRSETAGRFDGLDEKTVHYHLLRTWLIYYLMAPAWDALKLDGLAELRLKAQSIQNWQQLYDINIQSVNYGFFPL